MTISQKVSYIKGLADGLVLDTENKQDKLLASIIDVLEDVAGAIADVEDTCAALSEQLDEVDEDLATLENECYGDDECDCEECDDDFTYEVECPNCHDHIYLDEAMIEEGMIKCPGCGTELEFDLDEVPDEDADDAEKAPEADEPAEEEISSETEEN